VAPCISALARSIALPAVRIHFAALVVLVVGTAVYGAQPRPHLSARDQFTLSWRRGRNNPPRRPIFVVVCPELLPCALDEFFWLPTAYKSQLEIEVARTPECRWIFNLCGVSTKNSSNAHGRSSGQTTTKNQGAGRNYFGLVLAGESELIARAEMRPRLSAVDSSAYDQYNKRREYGCERQARNGPRSAEIHGALRTVESPISERTYFRRQTATTLNVRPNTRYSIEPKSSAL